MKDYKILLDKLRTPMNFDVSLMETCKEAADAIENLELAIDDCESRIYDLEDRIDTLSDEIENLHYEIDSVRDQSTD